MENKQSKVALQNRWIYKKITEKRKHWVLKSKVKYERLKSYINEIDVSYMAYRDLTPKDDLSTNEAYINSLDWAIDNKEIYNIALTGPYGSGKSSILKTFESNRPNHSYLNISLALFNPNVAESNIEKSENTNSKEKEDAKIIRDDISEAEIEKRILQQLFYKVKSSKIPFTRFRKIMHIDNKAIINKLVLIISTFCLGTFLLAPSKVSNLKNIITENVTTIHSYKLPFCDYNIPYTIIIMAYIALIILLSHLLVKIIKDILKNVRLSKINIKDAEFEVNSNNNESIFNKYLDEILYFFEVNKYDIVFIEDLDRFGDVKIFTKLRELNVLINNSDQINRRVIFIYAIKDDMFANKDRTKFFDYMLPVIPVINSSNSGEILWKELVSNDLSEGLTESFINDITIYVDDMRILNNIINEYIIYKTRLSTSDTSFLSLERLFSMIVYKNINPNDFSRLQFNEGIIHDTFNSKIIVIDEHIKFVKQKYEDLEAKVNIIKKEHLDLIDEVKVIFWYKAVKQRSDAVNINVNGSSYNLDQLLDKSFDLSCIKSKFTFSYKAGYYNNIVNDEAGLNFAEIEVYAQRIKNAKLKEELDLNNIRKKIEELKDEESHIKSWTLKKIMDKSGVKKFFKDRNKENALIIFLLRNGHIDEMYHNYMNYFYEGSLTYQDMTFIMKIKDQLPLSFDYGLIKVEKIVTRLNEIEFYRKEILNFNLVNYILNNKENYEDELRSIITQLSDESQISIDFIDEFRRKVNNKGLFMKLLCLSWTNIWKYIILNSEYFIGKQNEYLVDILKQLDIRNIVDFNNEDCLSDYISNMATFLEFSLQVDNISKIKLILIELNIKFRKLNIIEEYSVEILDFIFEKDLYKINYEMIELILSNKGDFEESLLSTCNYTTIMKSSYEPLGKYINSNITEYIENIFLCLETNTEESEESVLVLLNHENLSLELKKDILEKEKAQISDINEVSNDLWDNLVSNLKVVSNWDNILSYFNKSMEININLIGFLNIDNNYKLLSKEKLNSTSTFSDEQYKLFSKLLIMCDGVSEVAFIELRRSIPWVYADFPIGDLTDNRMQSVLMNNILSFTVVNYNNIREYYKDKLCLFINKNINKFIEDIDNFTIDNEDIFKVLDMDSISVHKKIDLILKVEANISCDTDKYARLLYGMSFHYTSAFHLSERLFKEVLQNDILQDNKIQLIINQKEYLNFNCMNEYLDLVGAPYSDIMILRKKPLLYLTTANVNLVNMIKAKGLISSFTYVGSNKIKVIANYK